MIKSIQKVYTSLHPFIRVGLYIAGNFALLFLAQMAGGLGEVAVNILLCVVVILFTKFILYLEGRKLDSIGWRPTTARHWRQLIGGSVVGGIMLVAVAFFIKWLTGFQWRYTGLPWGTLSLLCLTVLASAYVQELVFRGYPFQLLLNKYGVWPAQIIMALLFGLMHIGYMPFSEMMATMFTTGIGALLFGQAYLKTNNLALPSGIHFGWNLLQILLPRHPSLNGKGIVTIVEGSFDDKIFTLFTWMLPYAVVIIVVYTGLHFYYRKRPVEQSQQL
jgi:uncharacterized protein